MTYIPGFSIYADIVKALSEIDPSAAETFIRAKRESVSIFRMRFQR